MALQELADKVQFQTIEEFQACMDRHCELNNCTFSEYKAYRATSASAKFDWSRITYRCGPKYVIGKRCAYNFTAKAHFDQTLIRIENGNFVHTHDVLGASGAVAEPVPVPAQVPVAVAVSAPVPIPASASAPATDMVPVPVLPRTPESLQMLSPNQILFIDSTGKQELYVSPGSTQSQPEASSSTSKAVPTLGDRKLLFRSLSGHRELFASPDSSQTNFDDHLLPTIVKEDALSLMVLPWPRWVYVDKREEKPPNNPDGSFLSPIPLQFRLPRLRKTIDDHSLGPPRNPNTRPRRSTSCTTIPNREEPITQRSVSGTRPRNLVPESGPSQRLGSRNGPAPDSSLAPRRRPFKKPSPKPGAPWRNK